MARKAVLGNKIRRLRRTRQLTQAQLAGKLLISASYLNLIEHNQRPLTVPLLFKISEVLDVDLQSLSDNEEAELLARLDEVFTDTLFEGAAPPRDEVNELVGASQAAGQAIVRLYRAYRTAREDIQHLAERLSDDPFLATSSHQLRTLLTSIRSFSEILHDNADLAAEQRQQFLGIVVEESAKLSRSVEALLGFISGDGLDHLLGALSPSDEVADFVETRRNYFADIEDAAAAIRAAAPGGEAGLADHLTEQLLSGAAIRVAHAPLDGAAGPPYCFDADAAVLTLSPTLPRSERVFQLARRLAHAQHGDLLDDLLASGSFALDASRDIGRDTLAKYFAGATLLPYDPFFEAAETLRYDIALLRRRFDVGFEQVCHRLTTLRRPGAQGVPFHLVRVDIAGNVTRRYGGSGIRIPHHGGICPLWNVHTAFTRPDAIDAQIAEMPDGAAYLCVARAEATEIAGHRAPRHLQSICIGAALSHAGRLVYADGLDLGDPGARVPVGPNCRVCDRADCMQRVHPALTRSAGDFHAAAGKPAGGSRVR